MLIVGGGAAALLMAAKLGAAGKRVVVLEQGPDFTLNDLISSQIWARRLKWGGTPMLLEGRHPVGFAYNAGWGVGGAALHQFGNWPRLHPEDFRMKSLHGRGADWPIDYAELRPYYDRIQEEVGLAGDALAETWRPEGAPYPMPPTRIFKHAELMAEGFHKIGIRTAPMPVAINTVERDGRAACIYDGWCEAGCPIGALANPQVTYLPVAIKAGVEIRSGCYVTRVLLDPRQQRAVGVEYYDSEGTRHEQPAKLVVLAAFVVENPRILFNSATEKHPAGLGNPNGLLGRAIMTHAGANVWAMFDEDVENHLGLSAALLMSQDGYGKESRSGAFGSYTWTIGIAQKPNDVLGFANARGALFGAALHEFMRKAARGVGKVQAVCEEIPTPENRVLLSDQKDRFGLPRARVIHNFEENAVKLFEFARDEGIRALRQTRAVDVWAGPTPNISHVAGGTPMGRDAASSITDSYGRMHTFPNLFVAGAGLFTTEGAVHPTFTVHALALRSVEHIIDRWGGLVE
ncbi:GMC family oxidoreductase [Bradyrhizobium manausense]|uniref:GMC family oxidoreductase N-terminal domain-containing protein n=1 Tax=Bradyrhizobium manausense TaxID=989370 RepID=UPI001BA4FD7E|nr:GMC family oxidoreductase [Bradyrhizobium manausense]MBR0834177.1 GMC family oxidoreductase [Bradyrhizobium manausense]